jgi:hypothetical protein
LGAQVQGSRGWPVVGRLGHADKICADVPVEGAERLREKRRVRAGDPGGVQMITIEQVEDSFSELQKEYPAHYFFKTETDRNMILDIMRISHLAGINSGIKLSIEEIEKKKITNEPQA